MEDQILTLDVYTTSTVGHLSCKIAKHKKIKTGKQATGSSKHLEFSENYTMKL